jgi:hypothetical protein
MHKIKEEKQTEKEVTLNEVGGNKGGRIVIALQYAVCQVLLDLHTKEVACEFLFQLSRIGRVEFDGKAQQWVRCGQLKLSVHRLFHVQPVFDLVSAGVLKSKVISFKQVHLLADLFKEHATKCFGLHKQNKSHRQRTNIRKTKIHKGNDENSWSVFQIQKKKEEKSSSDLNNADASMAWKKNGNPRRLG